MDRAGSGRGAPAAARPGVGGPLLFARYAYPPNALGYCGPADHRALLEYADARVVDGGLRQLARGFDGAWPYLELIAGSCGIHDPLDARVVEAYWVGNRLLDQVPAAALGGTLTDRFAGRAGRHLHRLTAVVPAGASPHHSFHVFGVYPWIGLLRAGSTGRPLEVLDRCRIRWGQVVTVDWPAVTVRSRPLRWDGRALRLGPPRLERVVGQADGYRLAGAVVPGDWVALHWDWVCDLLSPARLAALRRYSNRHLAIANRALAGALADRAPAPLLPG